MTPATPFAGTSQLAVGGPSIFQSILTGGPGLLHFGPVVAHPHIAYDVSYGNGLEASPGHVFNTVVNQVSPGILFNIGDHWLLDYTPTLRFYSGHQFQNGVDHSVNFSGGTSYHDWVFGVVQGFSIASQPLIETAAQTDQETFVTALSASHTLGSKMSFDLSADQNFRYVNQQSTVALPLTDSREWSTIGWLNYQFVPRFTAGIGVGFTYDNLAFGPDMTSEQYQGRINWRATDKLILSLTGGLDDRQFLNSAQPDLLSPIFSASVLYQVFVNTSFSISASRSLTPSFFQSAVTESTSVSASLHQRLLGKFFFEASGGYSTVANHLTIGFLGRTFATDYDSTSFNLRLGTVLLKRLSAAVSFQENFVSSGVSLNSNAYNYTTTQVGLSLAYRF